VIVLDRPDADALQTAHRMPDGFAHAPYLAVASFVDHHREDRVRTVAAALDDLMNVDGRGGCSLAVERDAFPKPLDLAIVGDATDADVILAPDPMAGVREFLGKRTIARQQQKPLGVVVQAPDGIHVVAHAARGQQIDDGWTLLRIGPRRDVATRFVEKDVTATGGCLDASAIHADVVTFGIGLRAKLAHGLAIHRHAPFGDQRFGGAT